MIRYTIAAAVILAVAGTIYATGYRAAEARCQEAAYRAQAEALNEDLRIAGRAAHAAEVTNFTVRQEAAENEERIRDLERDLAKRPEAQRCGLSDDDARRLRAIRTGAGAAPAPGARSQPVYAGAGSRASPRR